MAVIMGSNVGAFVTETEALRAVVERLAAEIDPEAIYLFGSRAIGGAADDSDFDLLVVTRAEDGEAGYDYDRVYRPIRGMGVGCDVVPCPEPDFEAEKNSPTSLCHEAFHRGRLIYERR